MPTLRNAPIILCVDDDSTGLRFRQLILEEKGYKVILATSAQQGVEVFQSNPVDLVVSDHLMGRATGTEMAAALKRLRPHVPIIILSGSSSPPEGTENADAYVCKSEGPEVLLNRISTLLAARESESFRPDSERLTHMSRERLAAILFTVVLRDITERRQAEEKQARLAAIVMASSDAIIGKTIEGIVTAWNKGAEQMFGYTAEEIIGKPAAILLPADRLHEESRILSRIRRGEKVPLHDSVRVAKDGRALHVGVSISPVHDDQGAAVIGASTIAHDLTQMKMAEQALRNSEKLVVAGRMAATVAHEINGPLEAVANILFLLEHAELSHTAHEFVRSAQEEVKRIGRITKLTLGFHREGGGWEVGEVRASELIDGVLTLYRHRIESLGVTIVKRYDSTGAVVADAGELRQVFSNLIVNAADVLAKKGDKLHIHVRDSQDWRGTGRRGIRITVADNGSGIPREVRHRLFEPFFTTKGEKGTGLGLWVSRSLVEKHGGRLRVRSIPGIGAAFSIFLPAILPVHLVDDLDKMSNQAGSVLTSKPSRSA
jgi:PAS domain S-box-containing protein